MIPISSAATLEKNKLTSTGAWLVLLDIDFLPATTIKLVCNNEDIEWPTTAGDTYQAFPMEIDEISEDGKGGLPTFSIRVSNVTRMLEPYVDSSDGGKGATVRLRIVHSDHLDLVDPELDETFDNLGCSVTAEWVTFKLGAENPMRQRCPANRYLKDHCRYKEFGGPECTYPGPESECDRTFARCKELGNVDRFGGFPGIDGGVYV